jgi:hypothetical protein
VLDPLSCTINPSTKPVNRRLRRMQLLTKLNCSLAAEKNQVLATIYFSHCNPPIMCAVHS